MATNIDTRWIRVCAKRVLKAIKRITDKKSCKNKCFNVRRSIILLDKRCIVAHLTALLEQYITLQRTASLRQVEKRMK